MVCWPVEPLSLETVSTLNLTCFPITALVLRLAAVQMQRLPWRRTQLTAGRDVLCHLIANLNARLKRDRYVSNQIAISSVWLAYKFGGQKTVHVRLGLAEHGADLLQPLRGLGGQLQEAAMGGLVNNLRVGMREEFHC